MYYRSGSTATDGQLAAAYDLWERSIERISTEAKRTGGRRGSSVSHEASGAVIAAYEGALIRVKINDDLGAFARFRIDTLQRLSTGS